MTDNSFNQTLALAGVCQGAVLAQQFARKGEAYTEAFQCSIGSLIITDPQAPLQVYGELSGLRLGFATLEAQLSNKAIAKDAEITRYVASLLGLERKLSANKGKLSELGERIEHIKRQQSLYDLMDEPMLANLARIYSDVISPIGPRIQIAGDPAQLRQIGIQHKVRASLLAGLRSAVLWRQLGGKRRYILLNRRKILDCALQALQQIQQL
ncbi:high frequency lysogenization protein HflD [Aliiglaciecola sp. CAU 1673]|uniref:high frequency lysogenization protein HflD n=1 Tax=Aliiglaciecola sp. CAU 1673 TaxID=3032595 RepID=UPI0023D9CD9D|nr:high frequency lysogenization protein HflD [Aliiglaciecola sp. CAU 1673]MDF2177722.1 high frequency lysogenization protein HflD [Aliiglaciecola sp. CAU 1673]